MLKIIIIKLFGLIQESVYALLVVMEFMETLTQ